MNGKLLVLALLASALLIGAPEARAAQADDAGPDMDSLVTVDWLDRNLDDPDLVVLDCTVVVEADENGALRQLSGRTNYDTGHIPGAGFADLLGALSDPDSPVDFTVPPPDRLVAAFQSLGIDDDSRVVLYDANFGVWAARVWWLLRWIGFDRAALLDGGLAAWTAADYPLSSEPAQRPAGRLTLSLRPELIADQAEVRASLGNDSVRLIDAMPGAHFRGEVAMYARPGHIPGAVNVPSNLLSDASGLYRSRDELEMLFDGDRSVRNITYCGGGIAAAADAFILTRLGFEDVAVYDGSLQEWTADPANPMELGDDSSESPR